MRRSFRSLAALAAALVLTACNPLEAFSFGGSWSGSYPVPPLGTAEVTMTIEVTGLSVGGTWGVSLPEVIEAAGTISGAVTLSGLQLTLASEALDGCSFAAWVRPRGFALIATVTSVDCPVEIEFDVDLLRLGS